MLGKTQSRVHLLRPQLMKALQAEKHIFVKSKGKLPVQTLFTNASNS